MSKPSKSFSTQHDPLFTILAKDIAKAIAIYKDGSSQKQQFERLIAAEQMFRKLLLTYRIHTEMYRKFISLIRVVNNNILSARPYFRENSDTFSNKITPALKTLNPEPLKSFNVNYHFIRFCRDEWIGLWPKKLETVYKEVELARTIIVSNNMPLAINRAKLFFRKTPKGHVSFMDMIETAAMQLCAAVDKYTGEYKKNFNGVIIGRCVGGLIDQYSETEIHYYPNDRRILYRANSIRSRQGIKDIPELVKAVNDSFAVDLKEGKTAPPATTVTELHNLMAAASLVSSDSNSGEEGFGVYNYFESETDSHEGVLGRNVEEVLGRKQEIDQMSYLARKLPIINQKILKLKGIDF